jgi:DNA-binding transcriptional LysR family regulator
MTPLLRALRERHPGVSFSLTERRWLGALAGLRNGEDDVAFVRDVPPTAPWSTLELCSEPLCLVLRQDHPLASRGELGLADLESIAGEPFVSMREWIETHARRWPFAPRIGQEVDSLAAALALVRAGFGNALFSASAAGLSGGEGVTFVPIRGQHSVVQLAWSATEQRAAVSAFIALARADA